MQSQRINITLPQELLKKLRYSVPEGKRSRFISHAIEDKLEKEKTKKLSLKESLKINRDYYNKIEKEIEEDFKYADAEIASKLP